MVIVLTGPMGCGKTTIGKLLSQRLGWGFEDGDDFHPPENIAKMAAGIPLEDADRIPWLTILHGRINDCNADGRPMVIACSALKSKYRELLGINQRDVVSVYLQGSRELLASRIAGRSHRYMKKELLDSQLATLEEPANGLTVDIGPAPEDIVSAIILGLNLKDRGTGGKPA